MDTPTAATTMQQSSTSSAVDCSSSPSLVTTCVPILPHGDDDDDAIPAWAMIEVNGELLAPRDHENRHHEASNNQNSNDDTDDASLLIQPDSIELGAVHFVNQVRTCVRACCDACLIFSPADL